MPRKKKDLRGRRNLRKRILEHENKIREEKVKGQPDPGAITFWEKEIANQRGQLARVERRLLPARRRRRQRRRG